MPVTATSLPSTKMAYWFHRNPLKATAPVNYELHGISTNDTTRKILSDLRMTRSKLLDLLTDPGISKDTMEKAVADYLSLLQGLCAPLEPNEPENKLRKLIKFKWSNSLLGSSPVESSDTVFEYFSMLFNVALWYTKHAAKLAAKDDPDMEEAKEIHKCLRISAGIFKFCKIPQVKVPMIRILGYWTPTFSSLQLRHREITLARAIELKHTVTLISALAYETAELYQKGDDALASLDQTDVGKWRKYFQLKNKFYLACTKCGEAIRGLRESVDLYGKAEMLCKEYATTKGVGTVAKPQNHLFFRKLGTVIKRTLEKCDRENGLIYHQKVAADAPLLELKATYGLVSPEEYKPPALNTLWSSEVYKRFSTPPSAQKPQPEKTKGKEETPPAPLPAVKEKEVPMSDKDPKNNSGCVVS
ncbi:hypothetical protein Btru_056699 [Bulinus truncatus]|nr:hypothetical protein Btru_056699 [Bulinus truncatus]